MKNEIKALSTKYEQLQPTRKAVVLLAAAFNLTIEFRGLHELSDADARKRGGAINEIQHKLLSQALAELAARDRYPDDVLFTILDEIAEAGDVQGHAVSALVSAIAQLERG